MSTVSDAASAALPPGPRGIGGWLILPTIGTVLTPLFTAWAAYQTAAVYSTALAPNLQFFVLAELVFNVGLTIGWIVAIVGLFQHRRFYPRLYVTLCVVSFVGLVADLAVAGMLFGTPMDADDARNLARTIIALVVWGPYMFLSKRVRNTFVV